MCKVRLFFFPLSSSCLELIRKGKQIFKINFFPLLCYSPIKMSENVGGYFLYHIVDFKYLSFNKIWEGRKDMNN